MLAANYLGSSYLGQGYAGGTAVVSMPTEMVLEAELAGFDGGWTAIDDLTADPIEIDRGFQSDRPDDLVQAPASAAFSLRNDVYNSGGVIGYYSPDSGNCRAGWAESIRVRLRLRAGTTLRDRFIGFVDAIEPRLGVFEEQTVAVTATSWLKLASSTLLAGVTAQIDQRGDQLMATVVALAAFAPPATDFGAGADTFPYALDDLDPTQNTLIDAFDSIAKSGLDRIFERPNGTLVYEPRATRLATPANAFVLTDTAPDGFPGAALAGGSLRRELAALYNRAQLTGHPRAVDASPVVLYSYPVSASNPSIAAGATVMVQAPYADPSQLAQQVGGFNLLIDDGVGGARIATADDAFAGLLPAADFQFFSGPNATGSDVSSQVAVSVAYEARQATFTITNSSGAPAYYYRLQCRGQGIYDYASAVGSATNASSVARFGGQTLRIDCPYQTDPTFLQATAAYVVAVYGVGISRFDQGIAMDVPADDLASLDQLLALDISDPIGVSETMSGIASGPYWINGVREHYDERCNLTLTWQLARRLRIDTWEIETAGRSEIDETTTVAFF